MVKSILNKLQTLKAKKYKVVIDNRYSEYTELCIALRTENYSFDITPKKDSLVTFNIKTKWQKKN